MQTPPRVIQTNVRFPRRGAHEAAQGWRRSGSWTKHHRLRAERREGDNRPSSSSLTWPPSRMNERLTVKADHRVQVVEWCLEERRPGPQG